MSLNKDMSSIISRLAESLQNSTTGPSPLDNNEEASRSEEKPVVSNREESKKQDVIVISPETSTSVAYTAKSGPPIFSPRPYIPVLPKPPAEVSVPPPVLLVQAPKSSNAATILIPTTFTNKIQTSLHSKNSIVTHAVSKPSSPSVRVQTTPRADSATEGSVKLLKTQLSSGTSAKTLAFVKNYLRKGSSGGVVKCFLCNFCAFYSDSVSELREHMGTHMFSCSFCDFVAMTRHLLVSHIISSHPDQQSVLFGMDLIRHNDKGLVYKGLLLDFPDESRVSLFPKNRPMNVAGAVQLTSDPTLSHSFEGCHLNKGGNLYKNSDVKPYSESIKRAPDGVRAHLSVFTCYFCGKDFTSKRAICVHLLDDHSVLVEYTLQQKGKQMKGS